MNTRVLLCAALLAAAATPAIAQAQQQRTVRITDRIARNHFENGNEYFRIGRYSDAAREFEHAFEISHQNELLYNIAWAYEASGDLNTAMSWYQRFDQAGAPGMDREVLRQRMENLRARMGSSTTSNAAGTNNASSGSTSSSNGVATNAGTTGTTTAPPEPVASSAPPQVVAVDTRASSGAPLPDQHRYTYRRSMASTVGPIVLIGVGAVCAGLGVWQGIAYSGDAGLVATANSGSAPWSNTINDAYGRAGTEGLLTWVFGGVAVAAVAGGVIWLAARGPGERVEVRASIRPIVAPGPNGGLVGVGGTF